VTSAKRLRRPKIGTTPKVEAHVLLSLRADDERLLDRAGTRIRSGSRFCAQAGMRERPTYGTITRNDELRRSWARPFVLSREGTVVDRLRDWRPNRRYRRHDERLSRST